MSKIRWWDFFEDNLDLKYTLKIDTAFEPSEQDERANRAFAKAYEKDIEAGLSATKPKYTEAQFQAIFGDLVTKNKEVPVADMFEVKDSVRRVEEQGRKDDTSKLRYELIPPFALEHLARIYTHGAQKYGDNNYRKGLRWSRVLGALERHLQAWRKGEDHDLESGELHLASVAWCAMTLIEYSLFRSELDDRVALCPEEWRSGPDARWEVSSLGKVRNAKTHRIRKLSLQSMGYPCFNHKTGEKTEDGRDVFKLVLVHRWVADVFWGPIEEGEIVHHRDGDKQNNAMWNLEITDPSGNMVMARRAHPEAFAERDARAGIKLKEAGGVMPRIEDATE